MPKQAAIFEQVIRPAFLAVIKAEPHRGSAVEGVPGDAWSGLYRPPGQHHRRWVEPVVVTVDLDHTGGVVVAHRAYDAATAMLLLQPGTNMHGLIQAMTDVLFTQVTGPTNPRPRSA